MKKDLTEIVAILDKSGSMDHLRMDALGGINTFITDQKKAEGKANLTLVLFDRNYQVLLDNTDIQEVKPLKENEYVPNGSTSLIHTVCEIVDKVGQRLAETPENERPEKVIVVIMTDGEENTSYMHNTELVKYTKEYMQGKISHQRDVYKWEFIFLGADEKSIQDAQDMGIMHTALYSHDSKGTRSAYAGISDTVSLYRSTGKVDSIKTE